MPLELAALEVKAIVKAICLENGVDAKRKNMFVASPIELGTGSFRHLFCVTKGGHGGAAAALAKGIELVADGVVAAASAGASGLGALGSKASDLSSKGGKLAGLQGAFKSGVVRDAAKLELLAGVKNLMHLLKAQDHLYYFGTIDTSADTQCGMWGGAGDDRPMWDYYVSQVMSGTSDDLTPHAKGSYVKGQGVFLIKQSGSDGMKPLQLKLT